MEYKIISNSVETGKEARYIVDEIKDNIFDELYMRATLDEYEIIELIYAIIKEDTEEDLKEYDLTIETEYEKYLDIENDCDLTDAEKEYITKLLTKQYGNEVLTDIINPVIRQKLNTEHYTTEQDSYTETLVMNIDIPLVDFGKKNEICRFLNTIE